MMPIFLPIAGISTAAYLIVGAGALVGFLSGLLGVGGGFLLTPLLMMIGIPPTVAAASDANAIVATSSSGVAAHFRLGNVDVKMGTILLAGGLIGGAIGVEIIKILRVIGNADILIKITYVVMLGVVGALMLADSLRNLKRGPMARTHAKGVKKERSLLKRLPFQMDFPLSGVHHSALVPLALGVLVGTLSAIMGVGGGFLLVPLMVYGLGMSAHLAVGTSLFQILFTCAGVCFMQASANHTIDVVLALVLAAGSTIAAQIGAAVSKRMRGDQLMFILAGLALLVAVRMAFSLVVRPDSRLEASRAEWLTGAASQGASVHVPGIGAHTRPEAVGETVKLTPPTVEIGQMYGGTPMRIEGKASRGSQVVVVARGPDTREEFKRKAQVGPIWMTRETVEVTGAPSLFMRYSAKPPEGFLSREEIDRFQLSPDAIRKQLRIAPPDPEDAGLRADYLELKLSQRVYRVIDDGLRMGPAGSSGLPYSVEFHWPRKAPPAQYDICVYECENGRVVKATAVPLHVVEVGLPARLSAMAAGEGWEYGVGAVVLAMIAGFGMDVIAAWLKRMRSAHKAAVEISGGRRAAAGAGGRDLK
jgi:uncharacterized membrane protein YfcA